MKKLIIRDPLRFLEYAKDISPIIMLASISLFIAAFIHTLKISKIIPLALILGGFLLLLASIIYILLEENIKKRLSAIIFLIIISLGLLFLIGALVLLINAFWQDIFSENIDLLSFD